MTFSNIIVGILCVSIFSDKGVVLIMVTVVIQLLFNIYIAFDLLKRGDFILCNKGFWKWSVVLALPMVPHFLSEILLGHADRIMINSMCGSAKAAIYNIVYQISMVMTIIRTGINGAYGPWLYKSLKEERYHEIKSNTNILVLLMAIMTLILMLLGPELLMLAAPKSYFEGVIAVPAIMMGCYFIFIYILFLNVEIYYEKGKYVAIASCVASAISIISNIYCIPYFGYLSAGYTTMLSYMIMAIMHYSFFRRIQQQNPNLVHIFDFKFIMFSIAVLILMMPTVLFLYNHTYSRWILIMISIVAMVARRKQIYNVIKLIKNK